MFEFVDLGSEKIVGFQLDGKVSVYDFDRIVETIDERLKHHDKISIYAEVASFGGMSIEALFKDVIFGLRNWNRFDKEAVVTDENWLRSAAHFGGKLTPGIEVRAFPLAEAAAARAWIASSV